jgi:ribose transport system permease protein
MNQKPYVPIAILAATVALAIIFIPQFSSAYNLGNVMIQSIPLMFVAAGQTIILLTGSLDMSTGDIVTLTTILASTLMRPTGIVVTVLVCMAASLAIGAVNGVGVAKFKLPPFLMTMAMMFGLQGINLYLRPVPGGYISSGFRTIAQARVGMVPVAGVVTLLILALVAMHVRRSSFGLHLYAVGGDERRARLAGISPDRVKIYAYMAGGLLAALAGLFLAARTGTGDRFIGNSYTFDSVTAAVLGGTSLFGGKGNLWGSIASAMLLGVIGNVLNLLHVVTYWQWIIKGLLLIFAVTAYAMWEVRTDGKKTAVSPN